MNFDIFLANQLYKKWEKMENLKTYKSFPVEKTKFLSSYFFTIRKRNFLPAWNSLMHTHSHIREVVYFLYKKNVFPSDLFLNDKAKTFSFVFKKKTRIDQTMVRLPIFSNNLETIEIKENLENFHPSTQANLSEKSTKTNLSENSTHEESTLPFGYFFHTPPTRTFWWGKKAKPWREASFQGLSAKTFSSQMKTDETTSAKRMIPTTYFFADFSTNFCLSLNTFKAKKLDPTDIPSAKVSLHSLKKKKKAFSHHGTLLGKLNPKTNRASSWFYASSNFFAQIKPSFYTDAHDLWPTFAFSDASLVRSPKLVHIFFFENAYEKLMNTYTFSLRHLQMIYQQTYYPKTRFSYLPLFTPLPQKKIQKIIKPLKIINPLRLINSLNKVRKIVAFLLAPDPRYLKEMFKSKELIKNQKKQIIYFMEQYGDYLTTMQQLTDTTTYDGSRKKYYEFLKTQHDVPSLPIRPSQNIFLNPVKKHHPKKTGVKLPPASTFYLFPYQDIFNSLIDTNFLLFKNNSETHPDAYRFFFLFFQNNLKVDELINVLKTQNDRQFVKWFEDEIIRCCFSIFAIEQEPYPESDSLRDSYLAPIMTQIENLLSNQLKRKKTQKSSSYQVRNWYAGKSYSKKNLNAYLNQNIRLRTLKIGSFLPLKQVELISLMVRDYLDDQPWQRIFFHLNNFMGANYFNFYNELSIQEKTEERLVSTSSRALGEVEGNSSELVAFYHLKLMQFQFKKKLKPPFQLYENEDRQQLNVDLISQVYGTSSEIPLLKKNGKRNAISRLIPIKKNDRVLDHVRSLDGNDFYPEDYDFFPYMLLYKNRKVSAQDHLLTELTYHSSPYLKLREATTVEPRQNMTRVTPKTTEMNALTLPLPNENSTENVPLEKQPVFPNDSVSVIKKNEYRFFFLEKNELAKFNQFAKQFQVSPLNKNGAKRSDPPLWLSNPKAKAPSFLATFQNYKVDSTIHTFTLPKRFPKTMVSYSSERILPYSFHWLTGPDRWIAAEKVVLQLIGYKSFPQVAQKYLAKKIMKNTTLTSFDQKLEKSYYELRKFKEEQKRRLKWKDQSTYYPSFKKVYHSPPIVTIISRFVHNQKLFLQNNPLLFSHAWFHDEVSPQVKPATRVPLKALNEKVPHFRLASEADFRFSLANPGNTAWKLKSMAPTHPLTKTRSVRTPSTAYFSYGPRAKRIKKTELKNVSAFFSSPSKIIDDTLLKHLKETSLKNVFTNLTRTKNKKPTVYPSKDNEERSFWFYIFKGHQKLMGSSKKKGLVNTLKKKLGTSQFKQSQGNGTFVFNDGWVHHNQTFLRKSNHYFHLFANSHLIIPSHGHNTNFEGEYSDSLTSFVFKGLASKKRMPLFNHLAFPSSKIIYHDQPNWWWWWSTLWNPELPNPFVDGHEQAPLEIKTKTKKPGKFSESDHDLKVPLNPNTSFSNLTSFKLKTPKKYRLANFFYDFKKAKKKKLLRRFFKTSSDLFHPSMSFNIGRPGQKRKIRTITSPHLAAVFAPKTTKSETFFYSTIRLVDYGQINKSIYRYYLEKLNYFRHQNNLPEFRKENSVRYLMRSYQRKNQFLNFIRVMVITFIGSHSYFKDWFLELEKNNPKKFLFLITHLKFVYEPIRPFSKRPKRLPPKTRKLGKVSEAEKLNFLLFYDGPVKKKYYE